MSWFYLALLAPFLFAIVNLIDDNLIHHVYKGPYFGAIISGFFGGLPLLSLFFVEILPLTPLIMILGTLAGYLTVIYLYFYFRALELESPSVVVAMFSLSPASIPVFAHFFLGERLQLLQLIGFCLVMLASFGLAAVDIKRFKFTAALLPIIVAALIGDVVALLSKYVYQNTNFYTGFMLFCAGLCLGGLYFLYVLKFMKTKNVFRDLRRNSKKVLLLLAIAEFIAIVAEFTQNLAISRGPISLVAVVEGIQPLYILLIALVFYRVSPKHFREVANGRILKKLSLMFIIVAGLWLVAGGTH